MNRRITRDALMMNIAMLISKRSTCQRAAVGCVITRRNRIITTGYNGPESNEPHCSQEHCNVMSSCIRSVHAEHNAIRFAMENSISLSNTRLYTTSEPCKSCSALIIESGITSVLYYNDYWNSGADLLIQAGIPIVRFVDKDEVYVR